jgi:arylsulfatase A-like enzyme/Tfp pilus assembly protein PilF
MRHPFHASICLAVALLLAGCSGTDTGHRDGAGDRRDVVLITVDTLRHDATGFSGAGKVETPALDRLASSGRVFEWAHAHSVVTLPSHATILTGRLPFEHGVRDNAGFVLPEDVPTLATLLRDAGYATGAFVSAFPLDRRFGLARGFDVYDDEYGAGAVGDFVFPERAGDETVSRAAAWWEAQAGRRRFLWVHLFTPHFPYHPAERFAERYRDAPYYGEAAGADAELAPLLDTLLALPEPPLIVFTSDHGESLGEHGEATHGLFAYEATLRVPLVVWLPGRVPPGRDERAAAHVDLVPTILDLLGLPDPPGIESCGRSLLAEPRADGEPLYFEALTAYFNRGWAPLYGALSDRRKAIDLPIPELYDLAADPAERDNLAAVRAPELQALLRDLPAEAREPVDRDERIDPEVVERLRSLGYVAAGSGADARGQRFGPEDDPKNLVGDEERMFRALSEYNAGHVDAAIVTLRELIAARPTMRVAYGHLAFMLTDQGRLDDAIELLRGALAAGADSEPLRRQLALALLRRGDAAAAAAVLQADGESPDPETQLVLARIAATLGRFPEAEDRLRRALARDPSFPEAHVDRGILLLMQDRVDEARRELEAGLEGAPLSAEGWTALGAALSRSNEPERAAAAWRRAVAADPRLPDPLFNLALHYGRAGRIDDAISALERYVALVQGDERRRGEAMLRELRATRPG